MPRWRWCWKRFGPGRPYSPLYLSVKPKVKEFVPYPEGSFEYVEIFPPELEALKLVDYEGLTQEEAGKKMNTSRGTVWRLLESGRKKIVDALLNGKRIIVRETEEKE